MIDTEKQRLVDTLRTLRDEIRLQIHLASMEAKEMWKDLEPRAKRVEADLEKTGREVVDQVMASLVSLRDQLKAKRHTS